MKILIYCTKKKPYLFENYTDKVTWDKVFARKFGEWNRFMLIGAKPDYIGSGNYYLNGFVCFECDCKEAFKYDFVHRSGDSSNFYIRDQRTERMKDCLSNDDLFDYGKGKTLYAYHFENVKPIYPMPITCLYKDKSCTQPLTKAPQSWCYAYQLVKGACFTQIRKILILSIRPEWLCKIANGEKDLEVRKTCPKEISRPNKCSK